jgi:hypothetical protein
MSTKDELISRLKQRKYLGDGLYAHFDGYHIVLTAPRENGDHYVSLEPEVLNALDIYRDQVERICNRVRELA